MDVCYCKRELKDDERKLEIAFSIDWGDRDEREPHTKRLVFCSFAHLADWATDRAVDHDETVVHSPPEGQEEPTLIITDHVTDRVIR